MSAGPTKKLPDLLRGVAGARVLGDPDIDIREVRDDSRQVGPGDLFVAVAGNKHDGRAFIDAAIAAGAAAVVTDADAVLNAQSDAGVTVVVVPDARRALGMVAANRHGVAALTNVTQDHLDYHETHERYFAAKAILFRERLDRGRGVAVLFADRDDGRRMRAEARVPVLTVATTPGTAADLAVQQRKLDG